MDPLSITAGIIAVLGAGGTIANGLVKVRRLKTAPDVLLQLNNEVTDLHLLIRAVDELCRQRNHLSSGTALQEEVICHTLERARHAVLELEKLIEYVLTKETNAGTEIDRLAWARALDRIQETKSSIRAARNDLNAVWAALSNRLLSSRIELELQGINTSVAQVQSNSLTAENLLTQITEAVWRGESLLDNVQPEMRRRLENVPSSETRRSIETSRTLPTVHRTGSATDVLESTRQSAGLILRFTERPSCEPYCTCSCHQPRHLRIPSLLEQTLGSLFIGYIGFPRLFKTCNQDSCRMRSTARGYMFYVFPRWFLEIAIFAKVSLSLSQGPEMLIRCLRVRDFRTTPSFQALARRQYDHAKSLVLSREASVLDVDEDGRSLLETATTYFSRNPKSRPVQSQVMEFLLRAGADAFQTQQPGFNAYAQLWKLQLVEPTCLQDYPILQSLLSREDPTENFGFNELHATVLRLDCLRTFENQVALTSRDLIDKPDNTGRTALSWAAELREVDKIRMLLVKGADPNRPDVNGATPFSYCAYDVECLTALLESGAHVDHPDYKGHNKLSKLVHAQDNVGCAELLLRFGANLNHKTRRTFTVLFSTLERFRPHTLNWLLEQEIDIEDRNWEGKTALLHLMENDDPRDNMLEMLLKKKPDYQAVDNLSEGVLHKSARFGSIHSMEALQKWADLSDIDVRRKSIGGLRQFKRSECGKTALELAEWRRDRQSEWAIDSLKALDLDPQAWFLAFESFHSFIKAAYNAKRADTAEASMETRSREASGSTEEIGSNQRTRADPQMRLRVPGSYPSEDDGH